MRRSFDSEWNVILNEINTCSLLFFCLLCCNLQLSVWRSTCLIESSTCNYRANNDFLNVIWVSWVELIIDHFNFSLLCPFVVIWFIRLLFISYSQWADLGNENWNWVFNFSLDFLLVVVRVDIPVWYVVVESSLIKEVFDMELNNVCRMW